MGEAFESTGLLKSMAVMYQYSGFLSSLGQSDLVLHQLERFKAIDIAEASLISSLVVTGWIPYWTGRAQPTLCSAKLWCCET